MVGKVVDASVLGAFLFGEPRAAEAASLMEGSRLYAPTLLGYELIGIARKKISRHPEREAAIIQALQIGWELNLTWVEPEFTAVLRLALQTGHTIYDASYLHLSRTLEIPLLTFDERLASAG